MLSRDTAARTGGRTRSAAHCNIASQSPSLTTTLEHTDLAAFRTSAAPRATCGASSRPIARGCAATTTRRSTTGASSRPRSSGPRCGGSAASAPRTPLRHRAARRRRACRARAGSKARRSISRRTCSQPERSGAAHRVRQRARRAHRAQLGTSCAPSRERRRAACARSASAAATASRVRREPARGRRRDARDGEPGRRVVVVLAGLRRRTPCSTASARSSRRCCSRPTATSTTARASIRCRPCAPSRRACRSSRPSSSCRTAAPSRICARCRTASLFGELLARARASPAYEPVPFDHPLYILYSSGTTGVPKCIVHGAGGTLLQHRKEHVLHTDMQPRRRRVLLHDLRLDDVELARVARSPRGATIVLYDGAPLHPDPGVLWRLAERERINVFGTSAKYLARSRSRASSRATRHALPALRIDSVDRLAARAVELRLRRTARQGQTCSSRRSPAART